MKMGRPPKSDPATLRKIVRAIRAGATRREAAAAGKIHTSTLTEWLALGRENEPGFRSFLDRVVRAEQAYREERDAAQAARWSEWERRRREHDRACEERRRQVAEQGGIPPPGTA